MNLLHRVTSPTFLWNLYSYCDFASFSSCQRRNHKSKTRRINPGGSDNHLSASKEPNAGLRNCRCGRRIQRQSMNIRPHPVLTFPTCSLPFIHAKHATHSAIPSQIYEKSITQLTSTWLAPGSFFSPKKQSQTKLTIMSPSCVCGLTLTLTSCAYDQFLRSHNLIQSRVARTRSIYFNWKMIM